VAEIMRQVGTMINARFEGLEQRLLSAPRLRPPLAADKATTSTSQPAITSRVRDTLETAVVPQTTAVLQTTTATQKDSSLIADTAGKRGKNKKKKVKKSVVSPPLPATETLDTFQATTSVATPAVTSEWVEVVKRKPAKKASPQTAHSISRKQAKEPSSKDGQKRKLRPPRSAAVVVSLNPEAEQQGLTFKEVFLKARSVLGELEEMQIPSLRFRESATGARLMEVSGPDSSEKADILAAKLRNTLGEGVRIARPVKTVDLRLSGLDDSIVKGDISTAISKKGGCTAEHVRVGEIRRGPGGMGTVWVQCPVTAAKSLSEAGSVLIGWSSVQVRMLEQRPMRCFRCFTAGHTSQRCNASTDRSSLCFRCGTPGHKSFECSANPHCPICAELKRPAAHIAGGKACLPPPKNKKAPVNIVGSTKDGKQPHQRSQTSEAMVTL
jgi:hypothetical protein